MRLEIRTSNLYRQDRAYIKIFPLILLVFPLFITLTLSECKCSSIKDKRTGENQKENKLDFDVNRFAEDVNVQKMVYDTRFSEIARRFGDVVFSQTYRLKISSQNRSIDFENKDLIEQAKNGDYHIKIENSGNKMMEIYYIDKKLYISTDGDKFFLHSDDLTQPRTRKEEVYSQANTFLKTYSHFIKFVPDGEEEIDGIRFLRFKATIGKVEKEDPKGRYYSLDRIDGYILIDRRSGGLVGVKLDGTIKYQKDSATASTSFHIESSVKKSEMPFSFKVPSIGTEPKKLKIEKDLLNRLEKMEEKVDTEKDEEE